MNGEKLKIETLKHFIKRYPNSLDYLGWVTCHSNISIPTIRRNFHYQIYLKLSFHAKISYIFKQLYFKVFTSSVNIFNEKLMILLLKASVLFKNNKHKI